MYTTPESFFDKRKKYPRDMFLKLSSEGKVSLLAIDEAHLISSWKSFRFVVMYNCTRVMNVSLLYRPEYGYLLNISTHFPDVPIMTLTATATPAIRDKLVSMLRDPVKEIATVNKPNISLHVRELKNLPKHGMLS